jgi:hypothetical protein
MIYNVNVKNIYYNSNYIDVRIIYYNNIDVRIIYYNDI